MLVTKLKAIADAIRGKTGKADEMTLEQMATEIEGIEAGGGEEVFTVQGSGLMYTAHIKHITGGISANHKAWPCYINATELVSYETDLVGNGYCFTSNVFQGCTKLESVIFSRLGSIVAPIDKYSYCTNLKTVQYGSVGYPMTALSDGRMLRGTSHALELTIYVDAETVADIPTAITGFAPWGNANAVIIYRNSTTGEVITE